MIVTHWERVLITYESPQSASGTYMFTQHLEEKFGRFLTNLTIVFFDVIKSFAHALVHEKAAIFVENDRFSFIY